MNRFFVVLPPLLLLAMPASAQDAPRPAALQALTACRAIAGSAERLACYDRAAAELDASVERKEVVVLDKQEVKKTRRSLFGFSLPKLRLFGNDREQDAAEEAEFQEIETTVKSLRRLRTGLLQFTIEDGAVWQTTESASFQPSIGEPVTIRKGLLGSYFIRFGKSRPVKGIRVG